MTQSKAIEHLEPSRSIPTDHLTPCPEPLVDLLELIRMIPADSDMPELASGFAEYVDPDEPLPFRPLTPEEVKQGIRGIALTKPLEELAATRNRYLKTVGGVSNYVHAFRLVATSLANTSKRFRECAWSIEITRTHEWLEHARSEVIAIPEVIQKIIKNNPHLSEDSLAWRLDEVRILIRQLRLQEVFLEEARVIAGPVEESVNKLVAIHKRQVDLDSTDETLDDFNDKPFSQIVWDMVREAAELYTFVRDSRLKLIELADRGKAIKHCRDQGGLEAVRELIDCWIPWREIISESTVEVDEHGRAVITDDKFAAIIKGVDLTRVRVCEICRTIFWAGRYDSLCCSSNCADKRRKRQHRARYKARLAEEIEAERAGARPKA
jgi:hypothetical protein